jgi:HSP20 family protein
MGEKERKRERERSSALEPFGGFGLLRQWGPFGRLFDELLGDRGLAAVRWSPAVDISEDEKTYCITVELAGAKRDDISIDVQGDMLTIRGEKKSEREDKDERRHVVERTYGSFRRTFTLPPNADAEQIAARFSDGVLTLEIPKSEQARPKAVEIKPG